MTRIGGNATNGSGAYPKGLFYGVGALKWGVAYAAFFAVLHPLSPPSNHWTLWRRKHGKEAETDMRLEAMAPGQRLERQAQAGGPETASFTDRVTTRPSLRVCSTRMVFTPNR